MPMYEYQCQNKKCKTDLYTELLSMKDYNKEVPCPECGEIGKKQFGCQIDKLAASKWRI